MHLSNAESGVERQDEMSKIQEFLGQGLTKSQNIQENTQMTFSKNKSYNQMRRRKGCSVWCQSYRHRILSYRRKKVCPAINTTEIPITAQTPPQHPKPKTRPSPTNPINKTEHRFFRYPHNERSEK